MQNVSLVDWKMDRSVAIRGRFAVGTATWFAESGQCEPGVGAETMCLAFRKALTEGSASPSTL